MKKPMKLYVGCGLTNAPDDFCDAVDVLKGILRQDYEVFDFVGKIAGSAADVYRWDIKKCVAECDRFIAICDHASTGLGWELSTAIYLGKPILGLAHRDAAVSRLILGAAEVETNFNFKRYENLIVDAVEHVRQWEANELGVI